MALPGQPGEELCGRWAESPSQADPKWPAPWNGSLTSGWSGLPHGTPGSCQRQR